MYNTSQLKIIALNLQNLVWFTVVLVVVEDCLGAVGELERLWRFVRVQRSSCKRSAGPGGGAAMMSDYNTSWA